MPWHHQIAAFRSHNRPQMRATRRTNLALLTVAILNRRALARSELARPRMPGLPQNHHQVCQKEYASATSASSPIRALTPSKPNAPQCPPSANWPASRAGHPL